MAALYGNIGEFDPSQEEWSEYAERLTQYFVANDVANDDKKRAIFLSVCGASTYKLLRGQVTPQKPAEKTFLELVTVLGGHFDPVPSVIISRYKFNSRDQQKPESVAVFMAELRLLAAHCNFAATLDEMLRDRLVCGINDNGTQRRLLAEPNLTFKKALELALALESAERDAGDLTSKLPQNPVASVNVVVKKGSQNFKGSCYRCGGKHSQETCKFKQADCFNCGKTGHIAKACKKKEAGERNAESIAVKPYKVKANVVSTEEIGIFVIEPPKKSNPITARVRLGGKALEMEVDTGAAISLVSKRTFQKLWGNKRLLQPSTVQLKTFTGERIQVLGAMDVVIEQNNQSKKLQLLVVKGHGPSLLGRDWLENLKLDWTQLNRVHAETNLTLDEVLKRHQEVFSEQLGVMKGVKVKIVVDEKEHPFFPTPHSSTSVEGKSGKGTGQVDEHGSN